MQVSAEDAIQLALNPTRVPDVTRAFSANVFLIFITLGGAAPGFDVNVAPSALEAMGFHKFSGHRPVHLGARFHTKQGAQRAAATATYHSGHSFI